MTTLECRSANNYYHQWYVFITLRVRDTDLQPSAWVKPTAAIESSGPADMPWPAAASNLLAAGGALPLPLEWAAALHCRHKVAISLPGSTTTDPIRGPPGAPACSHGEAIPPAAQELLVASYGGNLPQLCGDMLCILAGAHYCRPALGPCWVSGPRAAAAFPTIFKCPTQPAGG